jgi:hypothetical protein
MWETQIFFGTGNHELFAYLYMLVYPWVPCKYVAFPWISQDLDGFVGRAFELRVSADQTIDMGQNWFEGKIETSNPYIIIIYL